MSDPSRESRHGPVAQLLIAWSPLSLILVTYWVAQWVNAPLGVGDGSDANRVGAGLHVAGPADGDRALFGEVPSVWLQSGLADGSAHWWDALAAIVYVTHFVSVPLVTGLVWFRLRDRFRAWLATVVAFTVVGIGGYVLYPAAPPWLASRLGEVGRVERISNLGWELLHLDFIGWLSDTGQQGSNPVAAMPSLHAGAALLVTLFLWRAMGPWLRGTLLAYVLAMALTLVYTGEHYVVDVLAGWATAVVAVGVVTLAGRRVGAIPVWEEDEDDEPEPLAA